MSQKYGSFYKVDQLPDLSILLNGKIDYFELRPKIINICREYVTHSSKPDTVDKYVFVFNMSLAIHLVAVMCKSSVGIVRALIRTVGDIVEVYEDECDMMRNFLQIRGRSWI